jgi:hypothetical protein
MKRHKKNLWPTFEDSPHHKKEVWRVQVWALLLTLGIHMGLYLLLPYEFSFEKNSKTAWVEKKPVNTEIFFLEANKHVEEKIPDFSAAHTSRNQKAAQPQKTQNIVSNMPDIMGEKEDSQAIVEGIVDMDVGMDGLEEGVVLSGVSKMEIEKSSETIIGESDGVSFSKEGHDKKMNNTVIIDAPKIENPVNQNTQAITRPQPQPRPNLATKATPAPLRKTKTQVASIGLVAIDGRMSSFGIYRQQMIEAISMQWDLLARHAKFVERDYNTEVIIEIVINKLGRIDKASIIHSSASQPAALICEDAIRSREPYGLWSEEMIAMFGETQTIRIHFFYR